MITFLFLQTVCGRSTSLSMLGEAPDWETLEVYQASMTREVFERRLETIYVPYASLERWLAISDQGVSVVMEAKKPHFRYFIEFRREESKAEKAFRLNGLKIAIDPGHIGGEYARMEQRRFQLSGDHPVMEGNLVLDVARHLKERLEEKGAEVTLVRDGAEPVTGARPVDFFDEAEKILKCEKPHLDAGSAMWNAALEALRDKLFYRVSEIHARARLINEIIEPDLTLALHINAAEWPDGNEKTLVQEDHFHVLINGAYMDAELALDDIRYGMLRKILSRELEWELPLAESMASAFAERTDLPPYSYSGKNAGTIKGNPYLWTRNLLANRLYECPVIYLEPYVANSESTYRRIQAYLEARSKGVELQDSIIDEYVDSVMAGLEALEE